MTKGTADHPSHPSPVLGDFWPVSTSSGLAYVAMYSDYLQTLNEASTMKATRKKLPVESPQSLSSVGPKIPKKNSESFNEYKDQLDVRLIRQPLSRENYVLKFHHLLCWEEQEHDKILKQRYICTCTSNEACHIGRVNYCHRLELAM